MRLLAVLLVVLLLVTPCAAEVYEIHPDISERDLCNLYEDMLLKFTRHAEGLWHDAGSGLGYWGTGRSDWRNEGIRAISTTALAYGLLAEDTDVLTPEEKKLYLNRAVSAIRYAVMTHKTGTLQATDGKQWGNSWQSTYWTANLGLAAWIVWDDLDPDLRAAVERVAAFEADRLLLRTPTGNRWKDTKAEENAWDQMVVSLGANMFPNNAHAAEWREKSIEFMMNTLSTPEDLEDSEVVDGKAVKDWVHGVNVHPDFTLENHGFFHPGYTMVSPAEIGQGGLYYILAGNPVPQAANHHVTDNWRLLQEFMLPDGFWAYVQGMDWALNSDSNLHYLAWLATYLHDPVAAGMEKIMAQYMAGHQSVHEDGTFAGKASRLGFAREAVTAERVAYPYLYHKRIATVPQREKTIRSISDELNGVRHHILIDTITHRTDNKFASFSWRNRVMGLVMPISEGHEGNPCFSTPITNGLVGSFALEKDGRGLEVLNRKWRKTDTGFETEGVLVTNGGALKQEIRFVSVGEKTVIYTDRVTAVSDVKIVKEIGVPIGIENDEFTGNRRTLYYEGGSRTIIGPETDGLIRIPGNWANVDGRLGMVSLLGSGLAYRDVPNYNRDGAREDFLYGSYSDTPREFKAGSEIIRRVVVLYVETSPEETAGLASQVKVDEEATTVPLPEGGECKVLRF